MDVSIDDVAHFLTVPAGAVSLDGSCMYYVIHEDGDLIEKHWNGHQVTDKVYIATGVKDSSSAKYLLNEDTVSPLSAHIPPIPYHHKGLTLYSPRSAESSSKMPLIAFSVMSTMTRRKNGSRPPFPRRRLLPCTPIARSVAALMDRISSCTSRRPLGVFRVSGSPEVLPSIALFRTFQILRRHRL
jgi:hypothetical protein